MDERRETIDEPRVLRPNPTTFAFGLILPLDLRLDGCQERAVGILFKGGGHKAGIVAFNRQEVKAGFSS